MDAAALIQSKLTHMVNLSPEERMGGLQLGTKSFGHIEKISDYMDQNPHLIPSYVDVAAFKRDVQVVRDLSRTVSRSSALAAPQVKPHKAAVNGEGTGTER